MVQTSVQHSDFTPVVDDASPLLSQVDGLPPKPFHIRQRFVMSFMLLISNLICYLDRTNISVAIIPMAAQYKWSNFTQAQILSSFFWGYMTTQIIGGILSKKYGGKIVLYTGGTFLYSIS
jgi:ACS family sodium-dependent inorganic phosphate cotransporter